MAGGLARSSSSEPARGRNREFTTQEEALHSGYYSSFSGVDIVPIIHVPTLGQAKKGLKPYYVLGSVQTISYSIHRDKIPVRAFGYKNPRGFSSSHRTLAGSIVFAVFDRHSLYEIMQELRFLSARNPKAQGGELTERGLFSDEIPPFDILISAANEYGQQANMIIRGVTIVDEGKVMSIEDIYIENTMSYFARDIEILKPGVSFEELGELIDKRLPSPTEKETPEIPNINVTEIVSNWLMFPQLGLPSIKENIAISNTLITGEDDPVSKLKTEISEDQWEKKYGSGSESIPDVNIKDKTISTVSGIVNIQVNVAVDDGDWNVIAGGDTELAKKYRDEFNNDEQILEDILVKESGGLVPGKYSLLMQKMNEINTKWKTRGLLTDPIFSF